MSIKVTSDVAGAIAGLAAVRAELGRVKDAANDVNHPSAGGGGLFGSSGLFGGDNVHSVRDFENALKDLKATFGNSNSNDSLAGNIRVAKNLLTDMGDALQRLGAMIDGGGVRGPLTLLRNLLAAPVGSLGTALATLGGGGGDFTMIAKSAAFLVAALFAVPAAAAAAQFAISALTVVLTTFAAAVVAVMGPLGVLAAVLGGLGVAAVLAFDRLKNSSGPWAKSFRDELGKLKDGFSALTRQLAVDFLPWFDKVGKVALDVLGYFNHLAVVAGKGGLSAVFKSLSDGGFARLNTDVLKVVGPIGNVIAAVIKFAFGTGGAEGEAILKADFSRFAAWAQTAFEPIIKWFDKQHFEKTGRRWATELLNSPLMESIISHVGQFIVQVIDYAGARAWKTFKRWAVIEMHAIPGIVESVLGFIGEKIEQGGQLWWDYVKADALHDWNAIKGFVDGIIDSIASKVRGALGGAWHAVASAANVVLGVVDAIAGAIETAIGYAETLAQKLASASVGVSLFGHGVSVGLGGVSAHASGTPYFGGGWTMVGEGGPELVNLPRGSSVRSTRRTAAMGGGGVTINIFGADLSSPEQQRRVAAQLASLLGSHRAGGGF